MAKRRKKRKSRWKKPTYTQTERKVLASARGRAAYSRFRRFWGLKSAPTIKLLGDGQKVFVGLGRSPAITIADGPSPAKARKVKRKRATGGILVTDAGGRKMWIVRSSRGLPKKPRLKFLGWAPQTEYVPQRDIERAGSHKAKRHWVHKHSDDGGRWPKLFQDQDGNIHYRGGTYTVTDWIRK